MGEGEPCVTAPVQTRPLAQGGGIEYTVHQTNRKKWGGGNARRMCLGSMEGGLGCIDLCGIGTVFVGQPFAASTSVSVP